MIHTTIHRFVSTTVFLLVLLVQSQCVPTSQPTAGTTTGTAEETGYVTINVSSTVECLIQQVYSGMAEPLDIMGLNERKDLEADGMVTTDDIGEAQVEMTGCGNLWVFRDTQLEKATCRKSAYETNLTYCLSGGMVGVQHDCLLKMTVQTPKISVETGGTRFTVTYFPEDEVSLVIALDGALQVQSFANLDAGVPPVTMTGSVWFDDPLGRYPLLQPYNDTPIDFQFWRDTPDFDVLRTPQLMDWLSRTQFRFNEVDPGFLLPTDLIEGWSLVGEPGFHFSGDLFTSPEVWQAVETGIPWSTVWTQIQPDQAIQPQLISPEMGTVYAYSLTYNIDQAQIELRRAVPDEGARTVVILIPANNPRLQASAKILTEYLASLGFRPDTMEIDWVNLQAVIQRLNKAGTSTVWIQP
jgi:hypothetical protein